MRELKAKDIAPFTKILAKMELKETIKEMFVKSTKNKEENQEEQTDNNGKMISVLVWGVIENYYKAEIELFTFLAELEDKTKEEIAELSLREFIELIKELFSEKNISFFKSAAK